jgi:glycosyltransferase involved in cell wall biosynthesis
VYAGDAEEESRQRVLLLYVRCGTGFTRTAGSGGYVSEASSESLSGITICYVSTEAYGGVWRTFKQARALADAGARVVVAGFEGMIPEPLTREPFEVVEVRGPGRLSAVVQHPLLFAVAVSDYVRNRILGARWRREHPPASQRLRHRLLSDAVARMSADILQGIDLVSLKCAHTAAHESGARLVYASNELWSEFVRNPDAGISGGVARHLLAVERELIGDAAIVIAVSDPMADRLLEQYDIVRPLVLLNSPPQKVDVARPVSSPVRLVFHGGLSSSRNLEGLIEAMSYLRGWAVLHIHGVSYNVAERTLQDLIDAHDLRETVRLCGRFEYEQIVDVLSDYDVGVWTAPMDDVFTIALPNKLLDAICAGLAVATGCGEAVRQVLESTGCGVCVDVASPESIARDLGVLVSNRKAILEMKRAAVNAAPRYWWPEQGRKLIEAFSLMMGRS